MRNATVTPVNQETEMPRFCVASPASIMNRLLSNPSLVARRTRLTNTALAAAVFLDREAGGFAVWDVRCSFGSLAKNYNLLIATIDAAVGCLVGSDMPFLGTPVVNGFTVKGSHTPRARWYTILVIGSFWTATPLQYFSLVVGFDVARENPNLIRSGGKQSWRLILRIVESCRDGLATLVI